MTLQLDPSLKGYAVTRTSTAGIVSYFSKVVFPHWCGSHDMNRSEWWRGSQAEARALAREVGGKVTLVPPRPSAERKA
jgi:hypothetical protein